MRKFSFEERLKFSYSRIRTTDMGTIKDMIPSCVSVEQTTTMMDRKGADYIAVLKGGRELMIDAKARSVGCGSYWKRDEPELALERWSVFPCESAPNGKIGWTLDPVKVTDMVLFTFDPSDTPLAYLLPFHHLRKAFINCGKEWLGNYGPMSFQTTDGRYKSACLFVPATDIIDAASASCVGSSVNSFFQLYVHCFQALTRRRR